METTAWLWVILLGGTVLFLRIWVYPKARERHEDKVYLRRMRKEFGAPTETSRWVWVPPRQRGEKVSPEPGPGDPGWESIDDRLERDLRENPPPGMGPMGPSAPTGLPPVTPPVPFGGKVGPAYLTGALKHESEEALQLIRANYTPNQMEFVTRILPNPDWDLVSRMAADVLGAIRWYPKVVSPVMTDDVINSLMDMTTKIISGCIDNYRKSVPPGPDKDQALNILGFYLQNIRPGAQYEVFATAAWIVATLSLDQKVTKEEQAGKAKP